MKKLPRGFSSPIVLLAIGQVVGISVTFAYFQFKFKPASQPQTTTQTDNQSIPTAKVSPTASPDETASWKTYTSKAGYEIKYPTEWSEYHKSNTFQGGDEIAFKFIEQVPFAGGGFLPGAILILANPESFDGASLKDWYNNKNPSPQVPVNLKETALNGLNALKVSFGDGSNITYYVQEKGKIYAINYAYTVVPSGKLTQAYYSKLFDQILSTFKFE